MELGRLFIQNLRNWRKIKGFSQKTLAEKCGSAHAYIRQLECGRGTPSFAFIGKIAKALQIEPYQLFFDETAKTAKSARSKQMESIHNKLIESLSADVQSAFDELKNY